MVDRDFKPDAVRFDEETDRVLVGEDGVFGPTTDRVIRVLLDEFDQVNRSYAFEVKKMRELTASEEALREPMPSSLIVRLRQH